MNKTQTINKIIIFTMCVLLVCVGVLLGESFTPQQNNKQILELHIYHHIQDDNSLPIEQYQKIEDTKEKTDLTNEEKINNFIKNICSKYSNIEPELVESIVYHESRYIPSVSNGDCVGLMQVSQYWHKDRASKLGVNDMYDSYGNILVGVDYLSELVNKYEDVSLVLMLYNMNHNTAFKMYANGEISGYAKSVLSRYEMLKQEANT